MPMDKPSAVEVAAWHAVGRNYHRVEAALHARLAPLGLNVTAHEVMQNLLHSPGLSQQQLARRVFTAKSHLSGVVHHLADSGWVMRSPDPRDARAWSLTLTARGTLVAQKALRLQLDLIATMGVGVTAADMQRFSKVLHAIEDNLKALQHDHPTLD
jgi:DNA-binding MarR family transcriptional regulator